MLRADTEAGQAVVRLVVLGAYLAYLAGVWAWTGQQAAVLALLPVAVIYIAYAVAMPVLVLRSPGPSVHRRLGGITLDQSLNAWMLWLAPEVYGAFVWILMWVTIGNGLRYGTPYLWYSASVGGLGAGLAMWYSPYWRAQPAVATGLMVAIWVLPIYANVLSRQLARTRRDLAARAAAAEAAVLLDPLTGVANRAGFERELSEALAGGEDMEAPAAVVMIDLDGFKPVNDVAGHAAGDRLLVAIALQLRRVVRNGDCVARIGGDEFAILVRGATDEAALRRILQGLVDGVPALAISGHPALSVSASIGVCRLPDRRVRTAADALALADAAMYEAKRAGKRQYRIAASDVPAPPPGA